MKRLLLILALAQVSWATSLTYVQSAISAPGSPSTSTTVTLTLTAGNFVVVHFRSGSSTATLTVTTSKSDTVSTDLSCVNQNHGLAGTQTMQTFWIQSAVGGSTVITATDTSGSNYLTLIAVEYSGQAASAWDGCNDTINSSTSTSPTTGTLTTTQADDLLVGTFTSNLGNTLSSVTSGYTLRQRNLSSGTLYDGYWDNTNTHPAQGETFTVTVTANPGLLQVGIAAFKSAGATPAAAATQIGIFAVGP